MDVQRRQAPAVTRAWPASPPAPKPIPTDWPLAVPVVVAIATATTFALLPLDQPLLCSPLELATAALAAALAWTAMAIVREEERMNARGETLVPRRWRYDRRAVLLGTAGALAEAIEGLEGSEDVGTVLGALREGTRHGDALPEERARLCCARCLSVNQSSSRYAVSVP